MKTFLLFLISLAVSSCSQLDDNQIMLFNKKVYNLDQNEIIHDIKKENLEHYESFLNVNKTQIPLYRYVKNPNYEMYLGIPLGTTLDSLVNEMDAVISSDSLMSDISTSSSDTYLFRSYKKNNFYVSEYLQSFGDNLLFVLNLSREKAVSDTLFTIEKIQSRITKM